MNWRKVVGIRWIPAAQCPLIGTIEGIIQAIVAQERLPPGIIGVRLEELLQRSQRTLRDWQRLVDMLPRDLADILSRVRRGNFDVNLQHRRLDTTVNRLVMGIITAALFVGSATLWSSNVAPLVWGTSVPGAAGCLAAVVLGCRLLLAIRRSGDIQR